jgi:hypothetical protein
MKATYMSFVVSLKCESDTRSIDLSIRQPIQVENKIFVVFVYTTDNVVHFFCGSGL